MRNIALSLYVGFVNVLVNVVNVLAKVGNVRANALDVLVNVVVDLQVNLVNVIKYCVGEN